MDSRSSRCEAQLYGVKGVFNAMSLSLSHPTHWVFLCLLLPLLSACHFHGHLVCCGSLCLMMSITRVAFSACCLGCRGPQPCHLFVIFGTFSAFLFLLPKRKKIKWYTFTFWSPLIVVVWIFSNLLFGLITILSLYEVHLYKKWVDSLKLVWTYEFYIRSLTFVTQIISNLYNKILVDFYLCWLSPLSLGCMCPFFVSIISGDMLEH